MVIYERTCTNSLASEVKGLFLVIEMYVQQCNHGLTHYGVNFHSLRFPIFQKFPSKLFSFVRPTLIGATFFVIMIENAPTHSLESFGSNPFASSEQPNMSWGSSENFISKLSFDNSSAKGKSVHQILFLNIAKAFIVLKTCVA